ncbi:hypothetical protein [Nitratireductor basaltis]|uniref:Uncharacterized protein n=1 Tax=Nitratireductor basaltis TaxID=472175 RepID=A0A084U9S6_9HYPH|nr:hypothetical protein [Nitratireductor basaltis]KFB09712.1 hypothetical protein EL18_00729 [Nitratireductor basaltis]
MNADGTRPSYYLGAAALLTAFAALGGAGVALWQNQGQSLLISLTQNGLPFCF